MRDNAKSGALTEVTFYILLSLFTPRHGYAIMQFTEEKTGGQKKRISLYCRRQRDCHKRLTRLQELTKTAVNIIGGTYE